MQLHHHSRLKLLKNNRRCVERVEVRARSSCEQRLARWLEENGGLVSGVILDEDRQVRATELLEPGRCLVSVPRACQVRYDDVHDEAMLDLFRRVPQGSSSESAGAWQFKQALTLLLHLSKGSDSPLHPYLAVLPGLADGTSTPRIGMLLSDTAVKELQYLPLIKDIMNQKYWWDKFWKDELLEGGCIAGLPFMTRESFGWAVAVTNSRSFGLRRFSSHAMPAYIDMVDHDSLDQNCEVSSDEDGALHMIATRQILPGSLLRLKYGNHDNRNLLLSYGFVEPSNALDKFEFDLSLEVLLEIINQKTTDNVQIALRQEELLKSLGFKKTFPIDILQKELPDKNYNFGADEVVPASGSCNPTSASQSTYSLPPGPSNTGGGIVNSIDSALSTGPRVFLRPPGRPRSLTGSICLGEPSDREESAIVDPRLLAAIRLLTPSPSVRSIGSSPSIEGSSSSAGSAQQQQQTVCALTLDQLGDWSSTPLGVEHELIVLDVVRDLCVALYTSLGTTLQQDRALQAELQAACSESDARTQPRAHTTDFDFLDNDNYDLVSALDKRLSFQQTDLSLDVQDVLLAVQLRIGVKRCLEEALKAVMGRSKAISGGNAAVAKP